MDNLNTEINDEVTLKELVLQAKEYYFYLVSKWKVIAAVGIIGAFLGLGFSFVKKPVYTGALSFVLEDESSSGGGLGGALGLASQFGFDIGGGGGGIFKGANLTELFKSRSMVQQTLLSPVEFNGKKISLAEMYIQDNTWRDKWKDNPKLNKIQFLPKTNQKDLTREHDSILGKIYVKLSKDQYTVGQPDMKTGIIVINVSSTNEVFAKTFAETVVKVVSDFYVDTKSKKSRLNMDILERQSDSIRAELNYAITGVAVANDNTFNLNPALNVKRTPSARKQVDVQANTAILAELVKQTELAKVTLRRDTPLIQIVDRPVYPLEVNKLSGIKGFIIGFIITTFLMLLFLIVKRKLKLIDLQ